MSDGRGSLFGFGVCVPITVGLVGRRRGAPREDLPCLVEQRGVFDMLGGTRAE